MIRFRTFRNTDPPALASLWRACAEGRSWCPVVSRGVFEQLVLSKPYFDNAGLIVALDGEEVVGFGHAGFGPTEDKSDTDCGVGVVCTIKVLPSHRRRGIGRELLARCEEYLKQRGARTIHGGGTRFLQPYYWGLYGTSELPGILESDAAAVALFAASGYRVAEHTWLYRRTLEEFRPIIDRKQMQVRRQFQVAPTLDPRPATWWEACTLGAFDRLRLELVPRGGQRGVAVATLWTCDPICIRNGMRFAGLIKLRVDPEFRRQGLATFLLGEALQRMKAEGFTTVEVMFRDQNRRAMLTAQKLGFTQYASGSVFVKDVA